MIADTLYAKYIQERDGYSVLENEQGFIIYTVVNKECFIVEMYISPELRYKGNGKKLIDELTQRVPACDLITANIWLNKKHANETLLAALHSGFKVSRAETNCLLISKEIIKET